MSTQIRPSNTDDHMALPITNSSHLDLSARVNLGAYYTGSEYVDIVWQLVKPYLRSDSVVLDSSCGSGNFFRSQEPYRQVGNDIDSCAFVATQSKPWVQCYNGNALHHVNRGQFGINNETHLCIIGNPPYNDRTSIIRHQIKHAGATVDEDISTRDLGMSFLLSYRKLNADCVCVLHPLSYLIKRSNFRSIRHFLDTYRLDRGIIISSGVFEQASKSTHFPIVIALYRKSNRPMSYSDILRFQFEIAGGRTQFSLDSFDTIVSYVNKYPCRNHSPQPDDLFFWTLRDLNALKRNQTFTKRYSNNAIIIDPHQLEYYAYIDVIKRFAHHIPYYFGNCDVFIDNDRFQDQKRHFIANAVNHNPHLARHFPAYEHLFRTEEEGAGPKIQSYLQDLLGEHYIVH